ncbi:MAG: lipoyl(octanoyl) transferase LipB [Actinobacteria bacterium]|nr:lipoyl(octanoyl) transferase LipB [Actinomycetota bacterium]
MLEIVSWGAGHSLLDYETAWQMQQELHYQVAHNLAPASLVLVEHKPIFTAGSQTQVTDRPIDGSKVIDVDRGGRITWHGPGQLVGYPIVPLKERYNVVGFVRALESGLIATCAEFGLRVDRIKGKSGVWVMGPTPRKVAAIGIRVAKGVSMHGFALNCNPDLTWFDRIVPCGIPDAEVTSLSKELDRDVSVTDVIPVITEKLVPAITASISQEIKVG